MYGMPELFFRAIADTSDKEMANGMRNISRTPLSEYEIAVERAEIKRIMADESVFVFNDPSHMYDSPALSTY